MPVFTLVCALGTVALVILVILTFLDTFAAGTFVSQVSQLIPLAIVPAVIYFVMRWYRKKHGIDLSLAFREIPVE
jgi:membrane protein YdbS with pleckstrin-like domain